MMSALIGIRACVFDAYGTLLDFAAAAACQDILGERVGALTALRRDKQLEYTWLRSLQHRHADFWQVTGDALDYALLTLGFAEPGLRQRLMDLYRTLAVFPDVPQTLRRVREAGLKTAILANGTPAMLASAVEGSWLGALLDEVISVEDVGVFKPDPRVYQFALNRLGVAAADVSFQSSNAWDAYGASAFGMRVVWCNRYGQKPEDRQGLEGRLRNHPARSRQRLLARVDRARVIRRAIKRHCPSGMQIMPAVCPRARPPCGLGVGLPEAHRRAPSGRQRPARQGVLRGLPRC
jgi:2-haloacid dehalogenase